MGVICFKFIVNLIEIKLKFVPEGSIDNKTSLVQVMAWCHQAASHNMIQFGPRSAAPYDIARPSWSFINTLRQTQNGCHFPYNIFKCILLNENCCILIKISLKYVPEGPINTIQCWFRSWLGTSQATSHYLNQWWLSLMTHICVTRPQWVNVMALDTPM